MLTQDEQSTLNKAKNYIDAGSSGVFSMWLIAALVAIIEKLLAAREDKA